MAVGNLFGAHEHAGDGVAEVAVEDAVDDEVERVAEQRDAVRHDAIRRVELGRHLVMPKHRLHGVAKEICQLPPKSIELTGCVRNEIYGPCFNLLPH